MRDARSGPTSLERWLSCVELEDGDGRGVKGRKANGPECVFEFWTLDTTSQPFFAIPDPDDVEGAIAQGTVVAQLSGWPTGFHDQVVCLVVGTRQRLDIAVEACDEHHSHAQRLPE
jgi:hypothetical protein